MLAPPLVVYVVGQPITAPFTITSLFGLDLMHTHEAWEQGYDDHGNKLT